MQERSSKNINDDINSIAVNIVEQATGKSIPAKKLKHIKNPAAVVLGRLGGLKGGKARAIKLSAKKRSEIARKAAQKRWQVYKLKNN